MNKLDELFKNKLEDYSLPPSASAWATVDASLRKKKKTIVWFRIAACLALASVSWMLLPRANHNIPSMAVTPAPAKMKEVPAVKKLITEPALKTYPAKSALQANTIDSDTSDQIKVVFTESYSEAVEITPITGDEIVLQETTILANTEIIAQVEKPLVIEYTLESVADQQEEVASRSKLQRVVDFALDAKNSDGALTNLRQAKDDLFAFNFKKDKTKTSKN
jgi:hypothetical protein